MTSSFDPVRHHDILDPDRLRQVLQNGLDSNRMLPIGVYPLELAAGCHNIKIVDMLLKAGAKVDAAPAGSRPIRVVNYAIKGVCESNESTVRELCKMLIDYGADINGPNTFESSILFATRHNDFHAVKLLLDLGADVNHFSVASDGSNKITALQMACWARHEALMILLFHAGADDGILRQAGLTPFQECVRLGLPHVIQYYVEVRGEDLAQKTAEGKSLVQLAPLQRTKQLIRSLKAGAAIADSLGFSGDGEVGRAGVGRSRLSPI